jgi:LPS-assembly lipoprotein
MSWHDESDAARRWVRNGVALGLAWLLAGCFQPLYGDRAGTGDSPVRAALSSVDVKQIPAANGTPEARIAVELRNNLLFEIRGGHSPAPPAYALAIRISSTRLSVIVDVTSGRPDIENYGIDATYTLTDIATNKAVVTGQAFARVSYDIPGSEQRFARVRALRDAENRAAGVIAEQVKSRLASYFVAGT